MFFDEHFRKRVNATQLIHRRKIVEVWKGRLFFSPKGLPLAHEVAFVDHAASNLLNRMLWADGGANGKRMQRGKCFARRSAKLPPMEIPPSLLYCSQNHP